MANQRPAKESNFSNGVRMRIWRNETANGDMFNIQVYRVYKKGEDWKETTDMDSGAAIVAAFAYQQAYAWVCQQREAAKKADAA
jgi:hypothetical protein